MSDDTRQECCETCEEFVASLVSYGWVISRDGLDMISPATGRCVSIKRAACTSA